MTPYSIPLFCAFLCSNRKENKKSIYFQQETVVSKQIDDDFIFVELLCYCLLKINAEKSLVCTF